MTDYDVHILKQNAKQFLYSKKKRQITWWRLCEGGGLTKGRAGYTLDNQHKSSGGHTPPLSQNRSLHAGISNEPYLLFYFLQGFNSLPQLQVIPCS